MHAGARRLRTAVERTIRTERVSFVDIAHNPWLAARARAELDPLGFSSPGGNHHEHAQVQAALLLLHKALLHDKPRWTDPC